MEHEYRGRAIILNHENFEREETREGTQIDVESLERTLAILGFKVSIHNDLDYTDILMLVKDSK